LLALDEPARLQTRSSGQILEIITDTPRPPLEILMRVPGVEDVQLFGDRAHARVAAAEASSVTGAIEAALGRDGIAINSIRPIVASLEDVFIDLITTR
jgi:hypothetical protein